MERGGQIVVTGAAGFVGSNFVRAMLERGYRVIGVDNFSTGFPRNLEPFAGDPNFELVEADIRLASTFREIRGQTDAVVHLAAYKIPRYGNVLDTLHINQRGAENVLNFARRRDAKVVLASTSDVYGKNPNIPFKETDNLVIGESGIARWAYAVSKLYDEHMCFAYAEKYGLRFTIARFFGGYGRNQHMTWWGGPQSVFIDAILNGEPIDIHGDGLQTRSFTYVDDLVQGVTLLMESDDADGEIFNVGATREIAIIDLARLIWALMDGKGEPPLKFIPYKQFFGGKYEDVRRRIPDIQKARRILGFEPTVDLEEGLPRAIEWQRAATAAEHAQTLAQSV